MTNEISDIAEYLFESKGIDIDVYDDTFLLKCLEKRIPMTDCKNKQEYLEYLKSKDNEVDLFLNSMRISFSEFFRNQLTYSYLDQVIIPQLFERKRQLNEKEIRIWSAACAAGQEAYSIAILCDEHFKHRDYDFDFRIFASDISYEELKIAKSGIYTKDSLNKVTFKRLECYFRSYGDEYHISKNIINKIDFSIYDLLNSAGTCPPSSIFGNFDIVFCSNLLFYYKPEYRNFILDKMANSLSPHGYLITGDSEREIAVKNHFHEVFIASSIFQLNRF